jgi:hypothetical protein
VAGLLFASGTVLLVIGFARGYAAARRAMTPFVHDGEPTRTAIESLRPLPMRPRVRAFASRVALSIGWLVLAFYGLFLVAASQGSRT